MLGVWCVSFFSFASFRVIVQICGEGAGISPENLRKLGYFVSSLQSNCHYTNEHSLRQQTVNEISEHSEDSRAPLERELAREARLRVHLGAVGAKAVPASCRSCLNYDFAMMKRT